MGIKNNLLAKLFGNTERSIANWREEKRPIIELLEKTFNNEHVESFLQGGDIPTCIESKNKIITLMADMSYDQKEYYYHMIMMDILGNKINVSKQIEAQY